GGEELVPAFQIDHLGQRIWPVVARINAIIDAARDPWAAASWWLSPSGWLDPGVAPADLVTETGADDLLVAIAEGLLDGQARRSRGPGWGLPITTPRSVASVDHDSPAARKYSARSIPAARALP